MEVLGELDRENENCCGRMRLWCEGIDDTFDKENRRHAEAERQVLA
jgi:hypothetical protein